jgi:hypothetical protein
MVYVVEARRCNGERRADVVAVLRPKDGLHSVVPRSNVPTAMLTGNCICNKLHMITDCIRWRSRNTTDSKKQIWWAVQDLNL